jgi:DNA-binding transcriptional ArsR family regulator
VRLVRKIKERVRDLDQKLDTIIKRLDTIEAAVAASQQTSQLSGVLSDLRSGIALYSEPLKAIQRLYDARRFLKIRAIEKDEISRLIVQSLAMRGELNISQIERTVRAQRGKASRRIIRQRLKALEQNDVVEPTPGSGHKYKLVE